MDDNKDDKDLDMIDQDDLLDSLLDEEDNFDENLKLIDSFNRSYLISMISVLVVRIGHDPTTKSLSKIMVTAFSLVLSLFLSNLFWLIRMITDFEDEKLSTSTLIITCLVSIFIITSIRILVGV